MFMIPGFAIAIITFPGVIVHELAHQLFCRWFRIPVYEVVYFRIGNPAGYVVHQAVENKMQAILISVGPFIVNTVIGAIISCPAALPVFRLHSGGPVDYLLIYLGVSIAMHAFPSRGDANNIWAAIHQEDAPLWAKILGYPIVGLIHLVSLGSFFWLDFIYGLAVAIGIPNLIIALMK